MPNRRRGTHNSRRRTRPSTGIRWLPAALAVGAVGVAAFLLLRGQSAAAQSPWTRFGTQDVHSLAFVGNDARHLLFGHHGGLLESRDGGRTWSPLPIRQDAMSTAPAADGSIVIAGHEVFAATRDDRRTWTPIDSDLPNEDIHGFTRDPRDPDRMWAYLATGGLWESTDFGTHWTRVREANVLFPLAVAAGGSTRLIGLDATGVVASDDGGRTWRSLSTPEAFPIMSLAGTSDGNVLYAGGADRLFRSTDGGRSWSATSYSGSVMAVATTAQGKTVALVNQDTELFLSPDGGRTWPGP